MPFLPRVWRVLGRVEPTRSRSPRRRPGHGLAMQIERLEARQVFAGDDIDGEPWSGVAVDAAVTAEGAGSIAVAPHGTAGLGPMGRMQAASLRSAAAADPREWAAALTDLLVSQAVRRWQHSFGQPVHEWSWHESSWWNGFVLHGGDVRDDLVLLPADDAVISLESMAIASVVASTGTMTAILQVAGVDEPDLVETDGTLVYVLSGERLTIVRGCGEAAPEIVARLDLSATGRPIGMYLSGNRVTVVSRGDGRQPWESAVTVIDVEDPGRAAVVTRLGFDGDMAASRMVDGQLRLVLNQRLVTSSIREWLWSQRPEVLPVETTGLPSSGDASSDMDIEPAVAALETDPPSVGMIADFCRAGSFSRKVVGRYETAESFAERIRSTVLDLVTRECASPRVYQLDASGEVRSSEPLVDLAAIIGASGGSADAFVTVTAMNVHTPTPGRMATVGIPIEGRVTVLGLEDSLYVFSERQTTWHAGPVTDVTLVSLASDSGGAPEAVVSARGQVCGTLLNQFAADQRGGRLRVVVEHATGWGGGSGVVVLEQQGERLEEVGRLEGLAIREDVHAVRFAGDRVYFVTYETSDPLFVVDLSMPGAPRLLGELKVPGYSEFIHALDEGRLVTIGRDVSEGRGWQEFEALQVSVFDVSDPTNPRLLDRYQFPGGRAVATAVTGSPWTRGDGDHLAFGAYGSDGVITVPVGDGTGGQWLEVLSINASGKVERTGAIDHAGSIERTVRIADRLVAVSGSTLTVHDFNSLDVVRAEVSLDGDSAGTGEGDASLPMESQAPDVGHDPGPSQAEEPIAATARGHEPDSSAPASNVTAAAFASLAALDSAEQRSESGRPRFRVRGVPVSYRVAQPC